MLDELRQMAIFAKTAEKGSFKAAADELRLSPSVISNHVSQLEQHLGTTLLYRSTRSLSLTSEGEVLLEAAQSMVSAAEKGLQGVNFRKTQLSGRLKVTVPAILANSQLTLEMADFTVSYPNIKISLDYSDTRQDVIAGGYDVAIRIGGLKDSSLKAKRLLELHRVLVASPSYLSQIPQSVTPEDLKDCVWLELEPTWHIKPVFKKAEKQVSISNRSSRISTNNAFAISKLACAGSGLALLPEYLVKEDLLSGRLQHVLRDWSVDPLTVYAVWPSNATRDSVIKVFVTALGKLQ